MLKPRRNFFNLSYLRSNPLSIGGAKIYPQHVSHIKIHPSPSNADIPAKEGEDEVSSTSEWGITITHKIYDPLTNWIPRKHTFLFDYPAISDIKEFVRVCRTFQPRLKVEGEDLL
jgi:hypothetical protein